MYQDETNKPTGTGESDDVSWNSATVEEIKEALEDQYKRGNGK